MMNANVMTQRVPFGIVENELVQFEYFGELYMRVPKDSPEFEYDLIENEGEKKVVERSADIRMPLKMMRGYHARKERLMELRADGHVVETDKYINVTGNLPYGWVPVIINSEIQWFIKK